MFAKIEIIASEPVVSFRETVTEESSVKCLSKSPNKHNRLFLKAAPLGHDLGMACEEGKICATMDKKVLTKTLVSEFKWDKNHA